MATQIYPTDGDPLHPPNIIIYTGHTLEWGSDPRSERRRVQITTPDGQITLPLNEWAKLCAWIKSFALDGEPETRVYVITNETEHGGRAFITTAEMETALKLFKEWAANETPNETTVYYATPYATRNSLPVPIDSDS